MKANWKKWLAVSLCAALILAAIPVTTALAAATARSTEKSPVSSSQSMILSPSQSSPSSSAPLSAAVPAADAAQGTAEGVTKDETVYVLTDPNGTPNRIIVSDWLKNPANVAAILDETDLTDLENVKGDETWTSHSDGSLVWDAQGNDIYYQGNSTKDLPVDVTVSYRLNGTQISPAELAGQSGLVSIRFDYANHTFASQQLDGGSAQVCVPFVTLTGVVLDNDVFRNVSVTNGKLINDGTRTIVLGMAFPGLQESLDLDSDTFQLPDYVEITAQVSNFSLETSLTLASNAPFQKLDAADALDSLDSLSSSLDDMTSAMSQLMDGAGQLADGLSALADQSGTLADGVGQLQAGADQLSSGLNTLASQNSALNSGARQVFETLLSTASSQLSTAGLSVPPLTVENYSAVLNNVMASLDETAVYKEALSTVTAAVEEQRSYIQQQVSAAVQQEVSAQVTAAVQQQVREQVSAAVQQQVSAQVISAAAQMDPSQYEAAVSAGLVDEATQAAVAGAIQEQMDSAPIQETIDAKTQEQMNTPAVQDTISANIEQQMSAPEVQQLIAANTEAQVQKAIDDNMASDQVQSQLTAASAGLQSVQALKSSLDSYNTFYKGLQTYTAGVSQAASGAKDLKDGTNTLSGSIPTLTDAINQLRDGAKELSSGLTQFNDEAVQKLADAFDQNFQALSPRLRAIQDAAAGYQTYSGLSEGMEGSVKFIFRTDSIEAQ